MENKLKEANENIAELINKIVDLRAPDNGNCLKFCLLGENRDCCNDISCHECNRLSKERYRNWLIEQYIVK
jgi:hypothetical protein